jgi:myo-inositol-1(or 4)-monophosphatase
MSRHGDFCRVVAAEAGDIMRSHFKLSVERSWKDDESPLTQADTAIHNLVMERVTTEFPNAVVLSEEGIAGSPSTTDELWVCDPLDGTMPFITGYPTFVFALALCREGVPVCGVLYDPFLDRMVVAETGEGAWLNGERVHVSTTRTLQRTAVDLSNLPQAKHFIPGLQEAIGRAGARPTSLYSSAYAGLLLGIGQFAGVVLTQDTPWDGAAVQVIVEEAGGRMTSLSGDHQRYDRPIEGYVASNGYLHDELMTLIEMCRSQQATQN